MTTLGSLPWCRCALRRTRSLPALILPVMLAGCLHHASLPGPTPDPAVVRATVRAIARQQGVEPALAEAVAWCESGFDPRACSHRGAVGVMQLMPATARELGVDNRWHYVQNIQGGVTYLDRLLRRFRGDLELTLAAYNAGPRTVAQAGGIPPIPETRQYVTEVLSLRRRILTERGPIAGCEPYEDPGPYRRTALPTPYAVQPGESLSQIAWKFYGDFCLYEEIAQANALADPTWIEPGQELIIPPLDVDPPLFGC